MLGGKPQTLIHILILEILPTLVSVKTNSNEMEDVQERMRYLLTGERQACDFTKLLSGYLSYYHSLQSGETKSKIFMDLESVLLSR